MTQPVEELQRKVRQLDSDVLEIYDKLDAISGTLEQHTVVLDHHSVVLDQHTAVLDHHSVVLDQHTAQLTLVQESLAEILRRLPEAS